MVVVVVVVVFAVVVVVVATAAIVVALIVISFCLQLEKNRLIYSIKILSYSCESQAHCLSDDFRSLICSKQN